MMGEAPLHQTKPVNPTAAMKQAAAQLRATSSLHGEARRQWLDGMPAGEARLDSPVLSREAVEAITAAQLEGADLIAAAILDVGALISDRLLRI